ncbi:MAG: hypothetical protein NC300_10440 [Bacteroidales bacterium]|nr:hypothetical protein [Clostridium sp.]MCM1204549.1 hypothetical protein [Bacteroidales bacterium]
MPVLFLWADLSDLNRLHEQEGDEMKRIWNALRYGDARTKKCIGSVILFCVAGIGLIVVSGLSGKFYLFIFGMVSGVAALLISQTFTLVDDDFVAEVSPDGEKDTVKSVTAAPKENEETGHKHKKAADKETAKEEGKAPGKDTEDAVLSTSEIIEYYDHYNPQVMKRVKRKYRVKRDHRPIIIDYSKSYRIKECPAFIWRIHNKVYLLLLEKEPRKISISRDLIRNMGYRPDVPAKRSEEYQAFKKKNLITSVFEEYLPDYVDSGVKNDSSKCKNLYTIFPDICISNRSAADVMDLLCLNFMPKDKVTESDKINGFFKRVYSAHILFVDKVYSITEYKEAVEKILREMCYAELPDREFVITLKNLVKKRLISREYADYYMEMKTKVETRNAETARKRKR